jgi:ATP-dependent Clp protease ATP-binding subunit ClpA
VLCILALALLGHEVLALFLGLTELALVALSVAKVARRPPPWLDNQFMNGTISPKRTDRLQALLRRAGEIAARSGRARSDPADLVLALTESFGVAAEALRMQGVRLRHFRNRAIAYFGFAPESVAVEGARSRVRKVFSRWLGRPTAERNKAEPSEVIIELLAVAATEADALNHAYVGTEHLLLGFLRQGGDVAEFLKGEGITYENSRLAIRRLLGDPAADEASPTY